MADTVLPALLILLKIRESLHYETEKKATDEQMMRGETLTLIDSKTSNWIWKLNQVYAIKKAYRIIFKMN